MKIKLIFRVVSVFLLLNMPFQGSAQCGITTFTGNYAPTSGTTFVTLANYSPGTYFGFPVLSGGNYAISTCGAPIDSQISGWAPGTNTLVTYNDDNGPLCAGTAASVNSVVPNFTGFMNVQISQYFCQPGGSSSINVFIRQNNNLVITSSGAAMCSGETRSLTATPSSVGALPPIFGSAGTFSGTGVSSNIFTAPTVSVPTTFSVTYNFGYVSTTQTILVNPLPVVTANASNSVVCFGVTTTLNGGGASTYTWTGGATNGVAFAPATTATFNVSGTSTAGCTSTNVAAVVVTVNPLPVVSGVATNSVICLGGNTTLNGSGALTYTWTGGAVNGVSFSPLNTATYNLSGTSGAGCTSTNVAAVVVTVNALPVVTASVTNSVVCIGTPVTLTGGGATTYTWTNGVINGAAFTPTSTNTYTVTGTLAATGCTNTATRAVTVNPLPVVTASVSNPVICFGATTSVNASGANTYTWTGGVTNSVPFSPATTATFNVSGTSTAGCTSTNVAAVVVTVNALPVVSGVATNSVICLGGNTTLNGSGASTYTWTGGAVNGVSFSPANTATYNVSGTSGAGCTSTNVAAVVVTVNPLPVVTASATSSVVCAGTTITLNGGGATNYTWSGGVLNGSAFTPTASNTYTVTGTLAATGCTNTSAISITVNLLPIVTASVANPVICFGATTSVNASGANTYTWTGGVQNGSPFSPTTSSSYSVIGTNTLTGCVSTNVAVSSITVNALPQLNINASNTVICLGDSVVLKATGADTFTWTNGVINNIYFIPTTTNTYSVSGTNTLTGCTSSISSQLVTVNPLPNVTATSNSSVMCVGETVTLTANGANTYTWSTNVTTTVLIVSPLVTTNYTVTGTDNNGCINKSILTQSVSECTGFSQITAEANEISVYPNPNNGYFVIKANSEITLAIYNGFGQVVKRLVLDDTNNYEVNVSNLSNGVYFIACVTGGQGIKQKIIVEK